MGVYSQLKAYIDTLGQVWCLIVSISDLWPLSYFSYFKCSESVVSENNHALPENIVLVYFKVFLVRNSSFQENAETKVYALEDSLGVYTMHHKFSNCFVAVSPSTSDPEFHLLS